MTDEASYRVATWRERVWRRLGFRYHLGDEPSDTEAMEGWMCTESGFHFGIADRFRLLLSGRLRLRLVQYTTVQVEGTKNRLDWHIPPPGADA